MGTFPFLWELSQFYGNIKEAFSLDKGYVFSNNGNFPIFLGTFPFLWELSDFNGNFPIFMGTF
jgi:hypothetical protein